MAASWSSAVARIASPIRVNRKNANNRATTRPVTTKAATCRCWTWTPPIVVTSRPQGSPMVRGSTPTKAPATTRTTMSMPMVMIAMTKTAFTLTPAVRAASINSATSTP